MSRRSAFILRSSSSAILLAQLLCSGNALAQEQADEESVAESQEQQAEAAAQPEPSQENPSRVLLKKKKRSVLVDKKGKVRQSPQEPSMLLPDWQPELLSVNVRPILGFRIYKDSGADAFVSQGELGGYGEVRGIPLVAGNPGAQISPEFGFAVGQAGVARGALDTEWGRYERIWGGAQLPIYYKFLRQAFRYRTGVLRGGPLPEVRRSLVQSDTGVAIIPYVSAHYTLTVERSTVQLKDSPGQVLESYDHWLTGRFATNALSFFVHAGPGFTTSSLEVEGINGSVHQSETYVLARTGATLVPKFGLEGTAKYIFSSKTDLNFKDPGVRSPLEELGAAADQMSYPEDSLHASVFFGFKNLFAGFGVGWTYSLKILNMSERDGSQRERTTSNGVGIVGSFSL